MRQMSPLPQNPPSANKSLFLLRVGNSFSMDHTHSWLIQSTFCSTIVEKLNNPILLENTSLSVKEFYFTTIKSPWPCLQGPDTSPCPKPVQQVCLKGKLTSRKAHDGKPFTPVSKIREVPSVACEGQSFIGRRFCRGYSVSPLVASPLTITITTIHKARPLK